jgi:hypothetical protein
MNTRYPIYLIFLGFVFAGCTKPWQKEMFSFNTEECKTYFTEREVKLTEIRNWLKDRTENRPPIDSSDLIPVYQEDVDAMLEKFDNISYPFLGETALDCRDSLTGDRFTYFQEGGFSQFGPKEWKEWGFQPIRGTTASLE